MIRYALVCSDDHRFEAWFRDSATYDAQSEADQVSCPTCGSKAVRKAMMAPSIRRGSSPPAQIEAVAAPDVTPPAADRAETAPALPVALPTPALPDRPPLDDERFRHVRALLRELHTRVKDTAENVGPAFAAEARKIHFGETEARPIYGTAGKTDVEALLDDGIEVMPLPPLPDDGH